MAFSSVPNFGDPYAKVNERPHPQSGATIVEVLYGAIDRATGLPCSPEKDRAMVMGIGLPLK